MPLKWLFSSIRARAHPRLPRWWIWTCLQAIMTLVAVPIAMNLLYQLP